MKKYNTTRPQNTTVSCSKATQQYIANEAIKRGIPQRVVLKEIVEFHRRNAAKKQREETSPLEEKLVKLVKRDDAVVGFLRTQESHYLEPILSRLTSLEDAIKKLGQILIERL